LNTQFKGKSSFTGEGGGEKSVSLFLREKKEKSADVEKEEGLKSRPDSREKKRKGLSVGREGKERERKKTPG